MLTWKCLSNYILLKIAVLWRLPMRQHLPSLHHYLLLKARCWFWITCFCRNLLTCAVLLHYFSSLLSSPAFSRTPRGTYVLHLLQLKIKLMKYQPASIHDWSNFGRLKWVSAIIFFESQFIPRPGCFKKSLS